MRFLIFLGLSFLLGATSPAFARAFDFQRDTLAYSNDTFWAYEIGADGSMKMKARPKAAEPDYTRHCFVMCRAVLQFERAVRFAPEQPRLDEVHMRKLLRQIARQPAWISARPANKRIVVPGFHDLRELSQAHPRWLQDELGLWWPTYYRTGNWRMALGFPRAGQERIARGATERIDRGEIVALFMTRFRPLNHCVLAYRYARRPDGSVQFWAYDPNDASKPLVLTFDHATRSFSIPRTNYYPGGRVNVFHTYKTPIT